MGSDNKQDILASLARLYVYAETIRASSSVLDTMYDTLDVCSKHYSATNQTADWHRINNRYAESLLGERNMFVYILHLLTVEPPWVDVEILDSKEDQSTKALDIVVHGRTDFPETEQCKTGHLGKSDDLYAHKDWFKGTPNVVAAVCIERGIIYSNTLESWRRVYKEGASAISGDDKWVYATEFKEHGGIVTNIHPRVMEALNP